ncbi:MAG: alanine dehydrogenase, partial [Planctomycetota bacterium]|nr:alanine dehydrogenase [Planctomycetota bacterium]
MIIGVPKEIKPQENRIGAVPAMVHRLVEGGHDVVVQTGAGLGAGLTDEQFVAAGGRIA